MGNQKSSLAAHPQTPLVVTASNAVPPQPEGEDMVTGITLPTPPTMAQADKERLTTLEPADDEVECHAYLEIPAMDSVHAAESWPFPTKLPVQVVSSTAPTDDTYLEQAVPDTVRKLEN